MSMNYKIMLTANVTRVETLLTHTQQALNVEKH